VIVIVVGAGINGVTAAIELKKRGHKVVLVDPGPLPHPLAASTDISKAARAAYGADQEYTALAERAIPLWREWNLEFGTELYHEVGVMFVRQQEMKPGDFEYESFKILERRRHKIQHMNSAQLWKQFPAWDPERYQDGVLELEAGYVESGRVVTTLIERAKSLPVPSGMIPRRARRKSAASPLTTSLIVPSPPAATTRSQPSVSAALAKRVASPACSVV